MRKHSLSLLLWAVVLGVGGCATIERPAWLHPGPAPIQRSRAEAYDPYPDAAASPQIVGGRPRDYDRPMPEALRAQWRPWRAQW